MVNKLKLFLFGLFFMIYRYNSNTLENTLQVVTVEKHSSFYEQFGVKSISTLLDPHDFLLLEILTWAIFCTTQAIHETLIHNAVPFQKKLFVTSGFASWLSIDDISRNFIHTIHQSTSTRQMVSGAEWKYYVISKRGSSICT